MPRYTIKVDYVSRNVQIQSICFDIEKNLSKAMAVYKIKAAVEKDLIGIILLETDLDVKKINMFLYETSQKFEVKLLSARYGWSVPTQLEDTFQLSEQEKYPYFFSYPLQEKDVESYPVGIGELIDLLILVVFVILGVSLVRHGFMQSESITILLGILLLIGTARAFFLTKTSIVCDQSAVNFHYLLKPRKTIPWEEIQLVEVVHVRSSSCYIHTNTEKIGFSVGKNYKRGKNDMLIKTIISRAKLYFFDSLSEDHIIYRRSELI